jgi:hypothetical protein
MSPTTVFASRPSTDRLAALGTSRLPVLVCLPPAGRTVEAAGLRRLRGLFLVDLQRGEGATVPSPPPTTIILKARTAHASL